MTDPHGRFSERAMTAAMHAVADQFRLPAADATLLRLTNNAVFALPTAGVVIRIARTTLLQARVDKTVRLARWFKDVDAPTIRLAPPHEQPISVNGLLATVWHYLPSKGPLLTPADLGFVLRQFHALGTPLFNLPQWDPIADARLRLSDAEALSSRDHDLLVAWCDALQPRIADLQRRSGSQLVHGDAHPGNLLRAENGRIVLCDFDPTCLGPWQADLVAVPVGEKRFGRSGAHAELASSYGYDVTTDPDWPVLQEARELKMVVAAVPLLASAPGVKAEFALRLRSVFEHDLRARWTPFAELR